MNGRAVESWTASIVVALVVSVLASCGAGDTTGGGAANRLLTIETPTVMTGRLDVAVEEGPVGGDGISEINFGSVEVADGIVLVEISAEVVRAARVSRDVLVSGREFRVEIAGASEFSSPDAPSYVVASLEPVD